MVILTESIKPIVAVALVVAALATAPWGKGTSTKHYITGHVRVIDGDTWEIGGVRYRHKNIDAPETDPRRARCAHEVCRGYHAKLALEMAFKHGGARTYSLGETDRYGRVLALLPMTDGRDAGQAMIDAGVAKYYGQRGSFWCGEKIE